MLSQTPTPGPSRGPVQVPSPPGASVSSSAGGVGWVPVLACSGISRGMFLYKSLYTVVIRSAYLSSRPRSQDWQCITLPSTFIFPIYFLAEPCGM